MIKIISDVEVVQQKAGFRFTEKLLQATQSHDRRPTIPVLLVLEDGTELLMVREIEKGNMLQVNCKLPVVFYHPYFLLDNKTRDMVPPSLAAAIKTRTEASKICCDEGLVYAVYEQLTQHFSVEMIGRGRFVQGQVYRTSCQEVVSRFYTNQSSVDKAAFALTERMANGSRIREMLGQGGSDTRFTSLTELMAKEGLDAVVASSPLAVMELAGYPACGIGAPELLAIYQQGENEVIVFTPCSRTGQELEELGFRPAGQMSLVELLKDKRVGFEEDSLDVATYLLLAESCELQKASGLLRLWRESKLGSKDLAYFVLTASASKYAVEKTMAYAADKVRQQENLTEADLYRLYQDLVQKFVREEQIPVPIEIYFTNLHAGIRSPYPAVPSDYSVNRDGKTYKMDAGLMVLDGPRLMHACSDIARTICITPEGQEVYDYMQKSVHSTIAKIKPGQQFKDIYWTGIKELARFQERAQELGMLPEDFRLDTDYHRDIGHLLERQEAFTATYTRANEREIHEYMMGCIEYQWPYRGHGIAFEEMFVVGSQGGLCLTCD